MLKYSNGVIAQFIQDYSAENLSSKSQKTLYIINENNSWRIIAEKIQR
jgi:hypothetical protein